LLLFSSTLLLLFTYIQLSGFSDSRAKKKRHQTQGDRNDTQYSVKPLRIYALCNFCTAM
jgi:hypothetical protein